jgi:hypothetical protein
MRISRLQLEGNSARPVRALRSDCARHIPALSHTKSPLVKKLVRRFYSFPLIILPTLFTREVKEKRRVAQPLLNNKKQPVSLLGSEAQKMMDSFIAQRAGILFGAASQLERYGNSKKLAM